MPFKVPLEVEVGTLAAGERQKTEIIKQLYLERRFLVLDEPTSVLTPQEATEMSTTPSISPPGPKPASAGPAWVSVEEPNEHGGFAAAPRRIGRRQLGGSS